MNKLSAISIQLSAKPGLLSLVRERIKVRVFPLLFLVGAAFLPRFCSAQSPRAIVGAGTNNLAVVVNGTNAVTVLPTRTGTGRDRVALRLTNKPGSTQTNWIEFGATATSNSFPLLPGAVYEERAPVIDNRAVSVLGSGGGTLTIQEKIE